MERVRALGLAPGVAVDAGGRARLEREAEAEEAYRAAVRLLAASGRARQEVVARLRRKGLGKESIARAVGRLEGEGLLDDAEFARAYARARAARGYGAARVLADLARKGVERRVGEVAVAQELENDESARRERLEAVARKRAAHLAGLPAEVRRRRLIAYLLRRGFAGAEIHDVVRRVGP